MKILNCIASICRVLCLVSLTVLAFGDVSGQDATTASLRGHWQFSSYSGNEFVEASGSGIAAKYGHHSKPQFASDSIGNITQVLEMTPSNREGVYFQVHRFQTIPFSFEMWVKAAPADTTGGTLLADIGGVIFCLKENKVVALLAVDGKFVSTALQLSNTVDVWLHLGVVYDGKEMTILFDNSEEILRSPVVGAGLNEPYRWTKSAVGVNPFDGEGGFVGRIAAFKIYEGVLSDKGFLESKP